MTIPRNLSFLAEGASSTGVLGTANGGTGLNTLGTAGQALVVNSGATGLTYSTPSAGAMSLISTQTASNSAAISFTGLSGYDKYLLIYKNVTVVSGSGYLTAVLGTGTAPTYITSSYYGVDSTAYFNGSSMTYSGALNSNRPYFLLTTRAIAFTNTANVAGNAIFSGLTGGTYQNLTAQGVTYDPTTSLYANVNVGMIQPQTAAATAIQISFSAGNLATGTFSLYGISS